MTKRYRDERGQFTMSVKQIAKETAAEAARYYQIGGIYLSAENGKEYVYISTDEVLGHFQSFDGRNLFIPTDRLGTFLPDVASEGMELLFVE